ncbi:MAG: hypothetical protein WBB28_28955 [Crinalium sp.]
MVQALTFNPLNQRQRLILQLQLHLILLAIPSCKIQSFLITGIPRANLIIDGDGAGVAIIKGELTSQRWRYRLLTQSSKATEGIATLTQMKKGQYKVEIVSREDKFFTVTFEITKE